MKLDTKQPAWFEMVPFTLIASSIANMHWNQCDVETDEVNERMKTLGNNDIRINGIKIEPWLWWKWNYNLLPCHELLNLFPIYSNPEKKTTTSYRKQQLLWAWPHDRNGPLLHCIQYLLNSYYIFCVQPLRCYAALQFIDFFFSFNSFLFAQRLRRHKYKKPSSIFV